jgi:DNA-binding PadR family transcriptional regulator
MPGRFNELAESKLIILFLLYQMDMPLSTAQMVDFAVDGEYMDYFSFQQYIAQLGDAGMIESTVTENNTTMYTITSEGEEVLRLFSKQIPYSKRTAICEYVSDNKKRIKREFEVVANYFFNAENDYIVKCGVYEDDTALMEISMSVVSKEQAKRIKKNWKENVTELYGRILSVMIDENSGNAMRDELRHNFDTNRVSTRYCEEDEE